MAYNFPSGVSDGYVWWWGDGLRSWQWRAADSTWIRKAGTANKENRFTNPALQINDQNGNTSYINQQGFVHAEQLWSYFTFAGAGGAVRQERAVSPTPGGSQYRARMTVTTASSLAALADGDWLVFRADIEANKVADLQWGDNALFDPKFVVVRFGWRSPAGVYSWGMKNAAGTESYTYAFTITQEQANTDTVQIVVIPPNYWEVWPTGNALWGYCYWTILNAYMREGYEWWDSGMISNEGLTNNFMQALGNVVELFDIGFYCDPNATGIPPEFVVPEIEDDHLECLRYWQRHNRLDGVVNTATQGYAWANNYVTMRTTPAITYWTPLRAYDVSVAPSVTGAVTYNTTPETISATITAAGLTIGRPFKILVDGQTVGGIVANARM